MEERRQEWYDTMVTRGHAPKMDSDGGLDFFAHDYHPHNGPGCTKCGWDCCWHCEPDPKDAVPTTCE